MNEIEKICHPSEKPLVIILRGLPGSGKTHIAHLIAKRLEAVVVSTDHFWEKPDGGFEFNPSRLSEAHASCYTKFLNALGLTDVVVDNTNTRFWEYRNYQLAAHKYGCDVRVVQIPCPSKETLGVYHSRQTHGVPLSKMLDMWWRWEDDPKAMNIPYNL